MIAARAVLVGIACAVLHNVIMIVGDWAGLHYAVSLVFSFAIVVVGGYWLHSAWTFRGAHRSGPSFLRYVLVASANYPASLVGMYVFVDVAGLVVPIASPIVTVFLFVLNFLGNRWALRAGRAHAACMSALPSRLSCLDRRKRRAWLPQDATVAAHLARRDRWYRYLEPRYPIELIKDLAALMPGGSCRVLDIGAGTGLIGETIAALFPGKSVVGVDVAPRALPGREVPVIKFDGRRLPFADGSFDCALFCNVLHHVRPEARADLLREALRVTGGGVVVIKDHLTRGPGDGFRLWLLDFLGNAPRGAMVDAQYLGAAQWDELLGEIGCAGEILPVSAYRTGLWERCLPNRLEICFRAGSL